MARRAPRPDHDCPLRGAKWPVVGTLAATIVLVSSSLVLQMAGVIPTYGPEDNISDMPSPPSRLLPAPVPRATPPVPAPRYTPSGAPGAGTGETAVPTPTGTTPTPTPTGEAAPTTDPVPDGDLAEVVRVVDGDTAKVRATTGEVLTLRLIGMDTPETVHPSQPVGCYGPEASAEAKRLLPVGAKVRLVYDETQARIDYYGRSLVYLHLPGGMDYAEHMIATGHATEYRYRKDYQRIDTYRAQQDAAREAGRGLWGACPTYQ